MGRIGQHMTDNAESVSYSAPSKLEGHTKTRLAADSKHTASCKKLQYLDLIDTSLTDKTLGMLATLPLREELDLSGCSISKQAIKKFNGSRDSNPVKIRKSR